MFILFDARCENCHNPFKAEADSGPEPLAALGRYSCPCPRCNAAVTVRGEQGTVTEATSGWAVRATAVTGAAISDLPT